MESTRHWLRRLFARHRETRSGIRPKFILCPGALLLVIPLLVSCGAQPATLIAPEASAPAVAQGGTLSGDYVVLWTLYGTPTGTPTPNATNVAIWATINAGSPTAVPVVAQITMVASQSGAVTPDLAQNAAPSPIPTTGAGDPERGKALFQGLAGCMVCHDTDNGVVILGPSLKGIASRAGSRMPGRTAQEYLHATILQPDQAPLSGFPQGVMPRDFGTRLTGQQINDLIAYLMTLKTLK